MQIVEKGKIVKFIQTFTSPAHGYWGAFERTIRYPEAIPLEIAKAIHKKTVNETVTISKAALGDMEYDESLLFTINKRMLSGVDNIKLGMVFFTNTNNNRELQGIVKKIDEEIVVLDCNPPLAGVKNLISNICILEIRDTTNEERTSTFIPTIKVV